MRFGGKIQIRISEFKKQIWRGFLCEIQKRIMNPYNPHSQWIVQIKFKSGFLRFTTRAFFGERNRKSVSDKRFSVQKWYTTVIVHDVLTEPFCSRHFDFPETRRLKKGRFLSKFREKNCKKNVVYSKCKHLSYS